MKDSMKNKLENLILKYEELNNKLSSEGITSDLDLFKKISKEHADLTPIIETYTGYKKLTQNIQEAKDILSDPEMKEFAQEEIDNSKDEIINFESILQTLLIPKDPNDDKNIFLEIRAGTGGDEAALFVGDLFRMYSRYAESMNWRVEIMSSSPLGIGGFKEIIAMISGDMVYSKLKFESGVHRVQRVPETEAQ